MNIALALIVKDTPEEAILLERCLKNLQPYVDGIFITITNKKGEKMKSEVLEVCALSGAETSFFEWCNDFSKARNFNFSQVPADFDYILWCDADDIYDHPEKIKPLVEQNPTVDGFAFFYYYEVDSDNDPVVIHKKTQVIRNDGCVEWIGRLHEDFKQNRSLNVKFSEDTHRIHLPSKDHLTDVNVRNVEISKEEAEINPNDPRVYFNLANSLFGAGKYKDAKEVYEKFLITSQSDEEKYIALGRLSNVEKSLGHSDAAIKCLLLAIGMYPEIPDAYNYLGYLYFDYKMYDYAEKYLLIGLVIKPPYHKMLVFNPRDFDYNPMMVLSKIYFNKSRPDLALPWLQACRKIKPNDKILKGVTEEMEKEKERMKKVIETVNHIETLGEDKDKILYSIEKLPIDLQSHPAICRIRNKYFIKETSSGKDIAYYCGETSFDWNPKLFKTKGFGGSEEAVVNLAKQWAKKGYKVTVFNSCGPVPMVCDGVSYKPWWHYNSRDKYDITILWRTPRLADHYMNTTKLWVDLHDVVPDGEFNERRMKKIDKVFVKTHAHRILFPSIAEDKIVIIPNGQDMTMFEDGINHDPYLMLNTSSPDRSLDVLPKLFKEVRKQVPQARLIWCYGWNNFDTSFSKDKSKMEWKEKIQREMEEAGIEDLGRLPQAECARLYQKASVLAYPSEFYEIDCISVKKAQAAGCVPVTTDFGAFYESNAYGVCVESPKTVENWCLPYQFSFGISDEKVQQKWVDEVVNVLRSPHPKYTVDKMKNWAAQFDWEIIAPKWLEN